MRRVLFAGSALCIALLNGCSSDRASTDLSLPEGEAVAESVEGTLCEEVTAEELTRWTGRSQEVGPPVIQGSLTDCQTEFDDLGMIIEWGFTSEVDPFAETGRRSDYPGLTRTRVTLGPDTPAWLLVGRIANTNHARVVTNLEGRRLSVDASDRGGVIAEVDVDTLEVAALAVAEDYVS